ncbi:unnamed protein product, partial [Polarella glacialis]
VCVFNSISTAVFNVLTTVWASPFPAQLQPFAIGFMSVWMRIGSIIAELIDAALIRRLSAPRDRFVILCFRISCFSPLCIFGVF